MDCAPPAFGELYSSEATCFEDGTRLRDETSTGSWREGTKGWMNGGWSIGICKWGNEGWKRQIHREAVIHTSATDDKDGPMQDSRL